MLEGILKVIPLDNTVNCLAFGGDQLLSFSLFLAGDYSIVMIISSQLVFVTF